MESRAFVTKTVFFLVAQGTEVLDGTWDLLIVKVEVDAAGLLCIGILAMLPMCLMIRESVMEGKLLKQILPHSIQLGT